MNRIALWMLIFGVLSGNTLFGRDMAGQWQGTIPVQGGVRFVLKIKQAQDGRLSGAFITIDESPEETPLASVSLEGTVFKFTFDGAADRYEGTLSDDGTLISGHWFGSRHPGSSYPVDLRLAAGESAWPLDSSPHQIRFVTVDNGVKLEVLDWGGTGRPLVLLAGLGNDAHIYDKFAPKLAATYHVYGITRRGFGASGAPEPTPANYAADRLGDDVLEAIDSLKLDRPVVAGHSIAGEELSSIGSRHPDKVSGLIYLDAGYPYAFYDPERGSYEVESNEVRAKLEHLVSSMSPRESRSLTQELLQTDLPRLARSLEDETKQLDAMPAVAFNGDLTKIPGAKYSRAVLAGERKYTAIRCPVLAIFAVSPVPGPESKNDPSAPTETDRERSAAQAKAFEAGVPSAHVVRILNADHYVFKSNEVEVLREMNDFGAKLP